MSTAATNLHFRAMLESQKGRPQKPGDVETTSTQDPSDVLGLESAMSVDDELLGARALSGIGTQTKRGPMHRGPNDRACGGARGDRHELSELHGRHLHERVDRRINEHHPPPG